MKYLFLFLTSVFLFFYILAPNTSYLILSLIFALVAIFLVLIEIRDALLKIYEKLKN